MSFISEIRRLYRNLLDAVKFVHVACRAAERVNNEIQASNASENLKAIVAAWKTSTDGVCDAIQDYKNNLPGN